MTSTPPHWNNIWTPTPEHSAKELENRLTTLEVNSEDYGEEIEKHREQLTLHERAILGILGVLYVLAQDKLPLLAKFIRGLGQ